MINITFDLVTGIAKIASAATIVLGADVPVTVTYSAAPGDMGGIQLGLGTDAAPPVLLAYTEDFAESNATTWTGMLDASDTRLVGYMTGKGPSQLNLELIVILDGERQIAPHVSITVQPPIIPVTPSSEGSPSYYTEEQSDARYLQISAAFTQAQAQLLFATFLGIVADPSATATVGLAVPRIFFLVTGSPQAQQTWMLRAGTDAADGVGIIHPTDYDVATNQKVFVRVA